MSEQLTENMLHAAGEKGAFGWCEYDRYLQLKEPAIDLEACPNPIRLKIFQELDKDYEEAKRELEKEQQQ